MNLTPTQPLQADIDALLASYNARNFQGCEQQARLMTQHYPDHPLAWKVLGSLLKMTGRVEAALAPMRQTVLLDGYDAEAHNNLGVTLKDLGRLEEAEASYRRALEINPHSANALNNLGNLYLLQARFVLAETAFEEAIRLQPELVNAHYNLGLVRHKLGQLMAAERCYREAIRLAPAYAEAYINLGACLKDLGRLTEAADLMGKAVHLRPDLARAHSNLGNVLKDLGDLSAAIACYREAIRLDPADNNAYSNLLFSLNYAELLSPETALLEAKRYGESVSHRAVPKFTTWHVNPESKKLRVGFVSGDLRNHPVGYFIEGLLQHLDRESFELYAFPTHHKEDELTERLKSSFQEWVPIYGHPDADAARMIHDRGIQVLIDLSGHTAHNRLPVLAYKPAPVQATWLGYFATTGLPEMDFFIGDPVMAPESEASHFTEKLYRLAETWLCLAPPTEYEPIEALPALKNGYVTFGCFGNLAKMNDAVVALWSMVLHQVPGSRLFMKAKQLAEVKMVDAVRERFARHGISQDRLLLEGPTSRSDYFQAHNRVDMVLDTFPYPGGTTSTDALWMGVPVLTLRGDRFLSHLGESIATNAGQLDWIASDKDDYVRKAVALTRDLTGLAQLRSKLRDQVQQSPLMNSERFAQNFAVALRAMWSTSTHSHNGNCEKFMASDQGQGSRIKNYIYLIPFDAKYFFMGMAFIYSLKRNGTDLSRVCVLDFGLSASHRAFLNEFGVGVLRCPPSLAGAHPFTLKSHLRDFMTGHGAPYCVLMDADMIALAPLDDLIRCEVMDMESEGYKIALCHDKGPADTLGDFIGHFSNTTRLQTLLDTKQYSSPCLNIGLTIFSNTFDFNEWQSITEKLAGDVCYEQSAINLMCATNTPHKVLDNTKFNFHGDQLLSSFPASGSPVIVHFACHTQLLVKKNLTFEINGHRFTGYIKTVNHKPLFDVHMEIIKSFINEAGPLLVKHFINDAKS